MPSLPRLYAILDVDTVTARGLEPRAVVDAWLAAGVRLIQLRAKRLPGGEFLTLATDLASRARAAGAEFIVNDRADIAMMSGADGVHVGQEDVRPADLRVLGGLREMGLSTHTLDQLRAGLAEPATYFAIGPVFPTSSKAGADPVVGLEGVRAAAGALSGDGRPLVAIGGVTLENLDDILAAGASSVAVISDLLVGAPEARAREYVSRVGVD